MKKIVLIVAALVALTASAALAQPGINLSWNDCGLNGQANQAFACNTNSGAPFTLIASFVPPANINQLVGMSAQIDITTDQATLPDWWGFGGCRATSSLVTDFGFVSGPFSCTDVWQGAAAGGYAYDIGFGSPNRARFRIQCAIPADNPQAVDPSTEYYAFKALILKAKTTGAGSCAGCTFPGCIVLNSIQLFQPLEVGNDPTIGNPKDRNFATWQSTPVTVPPCPVSTPTRSTSWGTLKSLYR